MPDDKLFGLLNLPPTVTPSPNRDRTPLHETNPRIAAIVDFLGAGLGLKDPTPQDPTNAALYGAMLGELLPVAGAVRGLKAVKGVASAAPRAARAARPAVPAAAGGGDEVDDMIRSLGVSGGVEIKDPFAGRVNNASGVAGGGSAEEILRQQSMKSRGQQFVVYDRMGNERPIIGVDAQDYVARPGETFGIKNADGTFIKYDDRGGRAPAGVDMLRERLSRR